MRIKIQLSLAFIILFCAIGYILHFTWEYLQCTAFFLHGSERPTIASMFIATTGDILIVFIVYIIVSLINHCLNWFSEDWNFKVFILIALPSIIIAILIEVIALTTGRWSYTNRNPIIPVLNVSLLPILQMLLINPITFYLSKISVYAFRKRRTLSHAHVNTNV